MEEIAKRIKTIREEKKITQTDMALHLGLTRGAYIKIEKGITKSISLEAGEKIAEKLQIPFYKLFGIETSDETIDEFLELIKKQAKEIKQINDSYSELNETYKNILFGDERKNRIIVDFYFNSYNIIVKILEDLYFKSDSKELQNEIVNAQKRITELFSNSLSTSIDLKIFSKKLYVEAVEKIISLGLKPIEVDKDLLSKKEWFQE